MTYEIMFMITSRRILLFTFRSKEIGGYRYFSRNGEQFLSVVVIK